MSTQEIKKEIEKHLDNTELELPILSIENLPIEKLSKEFVDWYFKDDLSSEIIKEYKEQALSSQKQKHKIKFMEMIDWRIKKIENYRGVFKRSHFIMELKELKSKLEMK